MKFQEVTGQQVIINRLIRTVQDNRVSHSWLFFGEEGTGALPLAIAFAQFILCTNRQSTDSCGTCPGCLKTEKLIHPDLHFTFPVNKTRTVDKDTVTSDDFLNEWRDFVREQPYGRLWSWYDFIGLENKQGIISREDSKRLAYQLNLKSFESDYKIAIIWHPERMNDQAANKLLKLLEEPPPLTIFILVSVNPEQLLPTLRSRCVPLKIPRIHDDEISKAIIKTHQLSAERLHEVVRISEGNYLKALELVSQPEDFHQNFEKFRDLMRLCYQKKIPELIRISEELGTLTRERQKAFLEYGLRSLRESVAFHFNHPDITYITDQEMEFIPNFAPFITGENIVNLVEEITKAINDIERNANGRIVFLDMALACADLIRN
jgi:DNA polymerase-3 subunit delta'